MFDVNEDAKVGFRLIELLTGPERRRHWSAEDKARIVQESLVSGARASDVARRWQLSPQQVSAWAARDAMTEKPAGSLAAAFVPMVAEDARAAAATRRRTGRWRRLTAVLRAVRTSALRS